MMSLAAAGLFSCGPPAAAHPGAADAALSVLGRPYVYGAAGPGAFDCSGLVVWAYRQAGITVPRTSQAQAHGGVAVSRDAMDRGDVITYGAADTHSAVYVGAGMVVHSPNRGSVVAEVPLDAAGPLHTIRRY